MIRNLLIIPSLALPLLAGAAGLPRMIDPEALPQHLHYEKQMYSVKISPNGKYIGSKAGDASIYNVETGKMDYYDGCYLGFGNTIADNGWAVGDQQDVGVLMRDGEMIFPQSMEKFWFNDFNAITPDASRVVGVCNNPERGGVKYVPFVCDIDASGNFLEPKILPYPKLDLFRAEPQFVTAVWISGDGKTITGEVQDWRGFFIYPIIFTEEENGDWSYFLPSEQLFNPTNIEIPDNPWLNKPALPVPTDFMSGFRLQLYQEAMQAYLNYGGEPPMPEEYMNDEQFAAYVKAVNDYNDWYYSEEERINKYIYIFDQVLRTSPTFSENELAIHPDGDYIMIHGGMVNSDYELEGRIYKFYTRSNSYEEIAIPESNVYPSQILSDGTLVAATPKMDIPTSYLLLPNAKEFITMQEYLQPTYPAISEWMDKELPGGTGLVVVSDDLSVMSGGLMPDQLADYDSENADFFYSSYIITGLIAGVEEISATEESGSYRVYNLQGVKVLETKDVSVIKQLPGGIYIINGKKVILQ